MAKSTTKSPTERRLRKQIRHLLEVYTPISQSPKNNDHIVREILSIIDDEVRRTRMSIAPVIERSSLPYHITSRDVKLYDASVKEWEDYLVR